MYTPNGASSTPLSLEYTRSAQSSKITFVTWSNPRSVPTMCRPSFVMTLTRASIMLVSVGALMCVRAAGTTVARALATRTTDARARLRGQRPGAGDRPSDRAHREVPSAIVFVFVSSYMGVWACDIRNETPSRDEHVRARVGLRARARRTRRVLVAAPAGDASPRARRRERAHVAKGVDRGEGKVLRASRAVERAGDARTTRERGRETTDNGRIVHRESRPPFSNIDV